MHSAARIGAGASLAPPGRPPRGLVAPSPCRRLTPPGPPRRCATRALGGGDGGNDNNSNDIDALAAMLSARAAEMRASMDSLDDPIDLLAADEDEEDKAPPPSPPAAAALPPPSPSALAAAEARVLQAVGEGGFQGADFALVQQLGRLSVGSSGGGAGVGGVAAIAYAARFEPGVPYQQPAPVLLKEYLQRPLALNELLAVARLQEVEEEEMEDQEEQEAEQQQRPPRQRIPRPVLPPTSSKWRAATALPRAGEPPIVPLLGYFESPPSAAAREAMGLGDYDDGGDDGGDDQSISPCPPTFWLVYRWEGLRPMSWFLESAEPLPLPAMRVAERRLAGLPAAGGSSRDSNGGGNFISRALSALRRAGPSRAEAALDQRAVFLRAAAAGALAALAHCHGRGVAHGSLGAGCVMLSSSADDAAALASAGAAEAGGGGGGQRRPSSSSSSTSPPPLRVKLDNFGLATVGATRGGGDGVGVGASSSSLSEARTADLQALGATLAEAFFVGMSCYGGGGGDDWGEDDGEGDEAGRRPADRPPPPPPPRAEALRRLLFQLYGPDGKIAADRRGDPASLRSYLLQEPSGAFAPLVAFLDGGRGEEEGEEGEGGGDTGAGGGWRLLAALVEGETPAALLLSLHAGWLAGK